MSYLLRGQYTAALQQLDGVKSANATDADRENLRGLALLLKGNVREALASFDASIAMQPSHGEAHVNRGIALLRLRDFAGASAELEKIANDETSPLRATAAYHNALALDGAGKSADALQWIARALTIDPKNDSALMYQGLLLERAGDLQGAGKAYFEFLKRHDDNVAALLRFGVVAQRAGRAEVARTYLAKVVKLAPDSMEAVEARKHLVMWE